MAPTIRIDEEVWQWLKSHAAPLEDTPNSVLRRLAGLDAPSSTSPVVRQAAVADNTPPVRSAAAMRNSFRAAAEVAAKVRGLRVHKWRGGHRRSSSLIELAGDRLSAVLYVKTRADGAGFWGITKNHLDSLQNHDGTWFAVFLIGPTEKGYLLDSNEVLSAVRAGRWSFSDTGDYKIHEGPELRGCRHYNTYAELISAVIESVWRAA